MDQPRLQHQGGKQGLAPRRQLFCWRLPRRRWEGEVITASMKGLKTLLCLCLTLSVAHSLSLSGSVCRLSTSSSPGSHRRAMVMNITNNEIINYRYRQKENEIARHGGTTGDHLALWHIKYSTERDMYLTELQHIFDTQNLFVNEKCVKNVLKMC
jgi:hypothetical protein